MNNDIGIVRKRRVISSNEIYFSPFQSGGDITPPSVPTGILVGPGAISSELDLMQADAWPLARQIIK